MGQWVGTGLTGSGHHVINVSTNAQDISSVITTYSPRMRTIGEGDIVRVKYAGYYGIGCFSDDMWGCVPATLFYWQLIEWSVQDTNVPTFQEALVLPSVWWALQDGVAITLTVNW